MSKCEHAIQRECQAIAANMGIECFRRNVMAMKVGDRYIRAGEPGQADLYGWLPDGRHWECEVKRPGNTPTYDQIHWLHRANSSTYAAFWVDSSDVFRRVIGSLIKAYRVVYETDIMSYRIPDPIGGRKRIVVNGPSNHFNLET